MRFDDARTSGTRLISHRARHRQREHPVENQNVKPTPPVQGAFELSYGKTREGHHR